MPSPYAALTAQVLQQAVEAGTKPVVLDGDVDCAAVAEMLTDSTDCVITAEQVNESLAFTGRYVTVSVWRNDYTAAAEALRDRLEQDREPSANTPQGDK